MTVLFILLLFIGILNPVESTVPTDVSAILIAIDVSPSTVKIES